VAGGCCWTTTTVFCSDGEDAAKAGCTAALGIGEAACVALKRSTMAVDERDRVAGFLRWVVEAVDAAVAGTWPVATDGG